MKTKVAALVFATGLIACDPTPREIADSLTHALSTKDRDAVRALVHESYRDALGDRNALLSDLDRMWERFAAYDIQLDDVHIVKGELSMIRVIGTWTVQLEGTPSVGFKGPADISLLVGPGKPLVSSGLLTDLRDIESLLAKRRAALEANDAEAYAQLLHDGYRDGELDKDGALQNLRTDLQGKVIRHEPIHHQIEVRRDLSHVDERYRLKVGSGTSEPALARLTLRPSAGHWLIAAGLYAKSP